MERTRSGADTRRLRVFLDTNVIVDYLRGEPTARALLSPNLRGRVQYAINPIVLQELLLLGDTFRHDLDLDELAERLEVLPVEVIRKPEFLDRVRDLRNRMAHANDLLILGSAQDCDLLVTHDKALLALGPAAKVPVQTPEDLLSDLEKVG